MKLTLALTALAALALTGCATLDSAYERRVETLPPQIIRTNTVLFTNLVAVTITNAAGQVETQTRAVVVPVITYDYAPAVTVTNLVPRADVSAGAQLISSLPLPWAGVAGVALGWLYTAYAALRNRRLAIALVSGIEAGRRILQETVEGRILDNKIKDALITHQQAADVLDAAARLVQHYTSQTRK